MAIGFQTRFAAMLDVDFREVQLDHVGLNHLTWERGATVRGRNVLPRVLSERVEQLAEEVELPSSLLTLLGSVPSHYLRYFYSHDEVLKEQISSPTRAQAVMAVENELLKLYANPHVDTKPAILEKRGGAYYSEAADDLIASLVSNRGDVQVVNLLNNGAMPFLPDDHVIEVPATVGSDGVSALPIEPLPHDMAGLTGHVASYERLALEAAIRGDRERVTRALLAHPLVAQYDKANKLTDLLLAANSAHLAWAQ